MRLPVLLLLLGLGRILSAQCVLSCNEGLQISLDPAGQALITTQLVTPNAASSCPGALEITLHNNVGQQLPNPLTCNNIGQYVTARVRHVATGNYCTSDILVVDGMAPAISCPDKFVFCHQNFDPASVGMPAMSDNCTPAGSLAFNHFDTETSLGCGVYQNGIPVLKRIDRAWMVTDNYGNSSTCNQKIWVKHIQSSDITYPPNRDNISAPALSCGEDPLNLELTGEPTVGGVPVGAFVDCEVAVAHTDQIINHCPPAAYTIVRNWTTIDFCTGTLGTRVQLIKVEDKVAPVLTVPADITIGTDGFTCTGSISLPQATATDNCSAVTTKPTWQFGSGYVPYSSIPLGTHVVTYTATDACNNFSTATMQVTVEDSGPPQAICNASLQVSLSATGSAQLNAAAIGSNSSDNCGPVTLDISRDAEHYSSTLIFNCSDIGLDIPITLRVSDAVGLENFCETEISVRDFLKPNIVCPPAKTLNCLQNHTNLTLTGEATATDNCTLDSISYEDNPAINACNIGSVIRTWRAVDMEGNFKSCSQTITITSINTTTVTFPPNFQVTGCSTPEAIHPDATGKPLIGGQACYQLSVDYTDHVVTGSAPFCTHILRDWKVVDHCIYNPNGGTAGIWEKTQIIDIVDNTAPVLDIPPDITVSADQPGCMAAVNIPDAVAHDCGSQMNVSNNGAFASASGANASGNYPLGVHDIVFSATDACGNTAKQTLKITVEDQSPPTALCASGIIINIAANAEATLDPNVLNGGSSDACSPVNSLQFAVSPATFGCQKVGYQAVSLSVTDLAGNTGTCTAIIQVKDPNHICGGGAYVIDGTIRTPDGQRVPNIPLRLWGNQFDETLDCDTLGFFAFEDVPSDTLRLRPVNNENWLNGVTTYDLLQISKHILGVTPLESPLKMIAADANRSNSITTFDIVQLRKLILGIFDTVPGNHSWRFIDSSFVFPNPINPFFSVFPEEIVFNGLNSDQLGKNFTAQKIGDVNDSTDPANARAPQDTLYLDLGDLRWNAGQRLALPIMLPDCERLEGLQFELEFDPEKILPESIEFTHPELLNEKNVAIRDGRYLSVSWDNVQTGLETNTPLFIMNLYGTAAADIRSALTIRRERMVPEAYLAGDEGLVAIALWRQETAMNAKNVPSLVMYPNPGSGPFQVENPLKNAAERLRILDGQGRVVWEQKGSFSDNITVSWNGFLPGIYLIELSGGGKTLSGKLARI